MTQVPLALLDRRYRLVRELPPYRPSDATSASAALRYLGEHVELAIPVEVVALQPAASSDAANARRSEPRPLEHRAFWVLASQAAALRHPALPRVRDSFRQGDTYYVVLDGYRAAMPDRTLADRLQQFGRLSLREALSVGLQLCDALAHVAQVAPALLPLATIAPEHLVEREPGTVTLNTLDLHRWLDADAPAARSAVAQPYAAPEVLAGRAADVRADMYSIAAVLYTMLAGQPPARDGAPTRSLAAREPLVPAVLSDVIERALQADPDARYADPNAFGQALAQAMFASLPALVALVTSPRVRAASQPLVPVSQMGGQMSGQTPQPGLQAVGVGSQSRRASARVDATTSTWLNMRHAFSAPTAPRLFKWPQVWAHEVARRAGQQPLRRTGERALAALASALRLDD